MLYLMSLNHSPDKCPGVASEIRDRVLLAASTMTQVLQSHGCTYQGAWVSKSAPPHLHPVGRPQCPCRG